VLTSLQQPLWQCAFRPLFTLTTVAAFLLMLGWVAFLALGWPLPPVAGGPFVWHVHELLLGFVLAAAAGFVLTSTPEFTRTPDFCRRVSAQLVALWLLGRVAFWSSGALGWAALAVAALAQLGFVGLLTATILPRLWADPDRRHMGFAWTLAAMGSCMVGFYWSALAGSADPMRWLRALLGLVQMLIIVALSRISMRIVNAEVDRVAAARPDEDIPPYVARPPRRNMALLCIALFTLVQWATPMWAPLATVSGWLALAAAAAVLALMGDWHVGRALLRRWPLLLYAVYAFMAAGYALIGLAILSDRISTGAGTHLLTVGAIGLAIYLVMVIAGYTHSGLDKREHVWPIFGSLLIMLAALCRAWTYLTGNATWMYAAALLWCAAFALLAWHMLPVWWSARADGKVGCDE